MKVLENGKLSVGLLVTLFLLASLPYLRLIARAKPDNARVAVSAYDTPDTGGAVPGNPSRTEADMRRLKDVLAVWRKRQGGRVPKDAAELVKDMALNPKAYPHSVSSFYNPDSAHSDSATDRAHAANYFPYLISDKRPDGSQVGSPKPARTRDVLAYTELYYHRNVKATPGGKNRSEPVGFFIVLWDDGKVERVPFEDRMFIYTGIGNNYAHGFRGQAGVPPKAKDYWEFYKDYNVRKQSGKDRRP